MTTASRSLGTSSSERTHVLYGADNVINAELEFFSNSKKRIDTCMNYTRPSLAIVLEPIMKAFLDAKSRGVRLRYLTEITRDNISACKELMTIVDELRHLDGIKGNFMVSETEYLAPVVLFEKGKIASQIVYSNVKELVDQHQYMFDTLWNKAISAQQRTREIEEGIEHYQTRFLEKPEEVAKEIKYRMDATNGSSDWSIGSTFDGLQMMYDYFDMQSKVLDNRTKINSTKWIGNIDKDSIELVKIFLDLGMQIKHIKSMPPMNFAVSSREMYATIDEMKGGQMAKSLLISNEPLYVKHFNFIFEELWKNGIDAVERIKDIEKGVDLTDIEVIPSSVKAQELYLNIVRTATKEILLIFPTTNAFIRQEKIGAIQLAKERNVKVRILMPANRSIKKRVKQLKQYYTHSIDIRYIEQMTGTKSTILIVDRKASLVMELRDDSKMTFIKAIGLSTYSNSKAGVLSYVAIFENLWRQTELYQQLKEAHEQLKIHDKMQKEFINVAAHELRTPIQPILGLTQVIRSETKDAKQRELLDVTIRNAKRLQRLTEDILDVTRIESKSLGLKEEQFNLNDVITSVVNDVITNDSFLKKEKKAIKLEYQPQDIFVRGDKGRVVQVISNLLNNAIKFTQEGKISISLEMKDDNNGHIVISVRDAGEGINPEILPRLFTKFTTKSETGTGLGLFISKSIVEAHGGRIWAENNADGRGATFAFSLPLNKEHQQQPSIINEESLNSRL